MEPFFTSPTLSQEIYERWSYLCEKWQDKTVAIVRAAAAKQVFLYLHLGDIQQQEYGLVGKCFFYWDPEDQDQLHLLIQAEKSYSLIDISILPDGILLLNDHKFANPQQLLSALMAEGHIILSRVSVPLASTLSRVLEHSFDHSCPIKHPADYPPLLLQIALSNNDCATALQILEHPFIHEETPQNPNIRVEHLVNEAVKGAISAGQFHFLEYLIAKYDFFGKGGSEATFPLMTAIDHGDDAMLSYLTALYPSEKLDLAYPKILSSAAMKCSLGTYLWFLDHAPANLKLDQDELPLLLGILLCRLGENALMATVLKYQSEISWPKVLDVLLNSNLHLPLYISSFERAGGRLSDLSLEQQANLIARVLEASDAENALKAILERLPDKNLAMQKALKKVILNGQQIKILLSLGLHSNASHFEHLFASCPLAALRLPLFVALLEGITSLDEAKENLKLTAAFGVEAVAAVMQKFPSLENDPEFLMTLMSGFSKGAELLSKNLLKQEISGKAFRLGGGQTQILYEKSPQSLPIDEEVVQVGIKGKVAVDLLVDVFAPREEYDKILTILLSKNDLISDFWKGMIFSGQIDFSAAGWQNIAKQTMPELTSAKQADLLINCFYFCNPYLLALLFPYVKCITPNLITQGFTHCLLSVEPLFVKVLADNQYLHIADEFGNTLLHLAVVENNLPMVSALLENNLRELPNLSMQLPFDIARQKGALSVCIRLQGESCLEAIADSQLANSYEDLHDWLMRAFLNSSSKDFYRFLSLLESRIKANALSSKYLDFTKSLRDFAAPATLIVRFPNSRSQQEVYRGYGRHYRCYEEQQFLWGLECERRYQEAYQEFREQKMNIYDLFMKFAQPRAGQKGYGKWRMGTIRHFYRLITHFHGRYFFFWNIAQNTYRTLLANPDAYGKQAQLITEGYQLFYERDDIRLPVSKIYLRKPLTPAQFKAYIVHSDIDDLRRVLPYMSKLAGEITAELQLSGKPLPKEKIALFFWLGCHITMTARGNSQTMLMIHRLLYNLYDWQPAPWSLRFVQPDCIALLLPFELFYNQYYDALFDDQPSRCSTNLSSDNKIY